MNDGLDRGTLLIGTTTPVDKGHYPPPLMTSEPGSFARKTIVERKPQILHEVSAAYPYPPAIQAGLEAFAREIASDPIAPLRERTPDITMWHAAWSPFEGRTWLDVPWYFAESYFYRRLMEVVRYYQPGPWQSVDPFAPQKEAEIARALPAFHALLECPATDLRTGFALALHDALWGNRADLSNRTISARAEEALLDCQQERLLIDDTARIWQHLSRVLSRPRRQDALSHGALPNMSLRVPHPGSDPGTLSTMTRPAHCHCEAALFPPKQSPPVPEEPIMPLAGSALAGGAISTGAQGRGLVQSKGHTLRVDIVADNSGLELLLDLRLADALLRLGQTHVHLHLKRMPFFVSDAMVRDLEHTLRCLEQGAQRTAFTPSAALAQRLRAAIDEERIVLHDDPFWSSPLSYHDLPPDLARTLSGSDLILFKGDVNYRRLLDDRHWPSTTHLADIAAHMPAPFCALRTLKGELIVDLALGQAEQLAAVDPTWMINGQRGVIQFVDTGARDG